MKFFILLLLLTAELDVKLIIPPGYSKYCVENESTSMTNFLRKRGPQMSIDLWEVFRTFNRRIAI